LAQTLSTKSNLSSTATASAKQDKSPKMDLLKSNPYFAKYEAKLKTIYNENPQQFLATLRDNKPEKVGDLPEEFKSQMSESLTKKRTLSSIMKLDLVKDLPPEEIKNIWITYMAEKSRIAEMLTADDFKRLLKRSKEYTTFLLPMPRTQGYEFILAQWSNNECHFTPLINFQAHGENAPSTLTLTYFDELIESKQIALEMAEFDTQHLKLDEAKQLINQMKLYYLHANETDEKYALLECFSKTPNQFKHMDLIKQLEKDLNISTNK